MADSPSDTPLVRFEAVTRRFAGVPAVDGLSLDIRDGEFFALLGPSGCGKTTLLRMLAGFETPDEGGILLDGEDIVSVPPHRRPVNMMFQSYALFPHLTVAGNIGFGLRQERLPHAEIDARVAEMLALVRLEGFEARKPHQLSGGQQQRVALARSLIKRPRVLLLDEPMAALDKKLREEMQHELVQLQQRLGLTFVIVTHDQEEAMIVADRIGVMNRGQLVQVGAPETVYEQPNSRWIASFIGDVNLIEGKIRDASPSATLMTTALGDLRVASGGGKAGDAICAAIRPEKLKITRQPSDGGGNAVAGTVAAIAYRGDLSMYQVRLDDGFVMKAAAANASRRSGQAIATGDRVWLSFTPDAVVLLTK